MRSVTAVLLCCSAFVTRAVAQLGVSGDVQLSAYGGASRDTSQGNVGQSFRPYRPVLFTLRPEWDLGRWRVALGVSYGKPDIAVEGDPLTVVLHQSSELLEVAPEVSYRFWKSPSGTRVRLLSGPVLNLWMLPGEDQPRSRGGAFLGLSTESPVTTRLQATVRATGVLTAGLFERPDLPPEFELRSMRRVSLGLGVRYGH